MQRRSQTRKQASKQASTSCSPLDLVCCWGGALRPPPTPPRATKSALHPRHPRLPRNQYLEVNSPVQNFLTKQICLLYRLYLSNQSIYLSIYLSIDPFIDPFIFLSLYLSICSSTSTKYYTCHEICTSRSTKVLRLPLATNSALQHPQSPAPATKCAKYCTCHETLRLPLRYCCYYSTVTATAIWNIFFDTLNTFLMRVEYFLLIR